MGLAAVDDVARPALAAVLLFAVCGFGVVRLLLPAELRDHELLWMLPVGACTAALALALLGYARVPFAVALPAVLVAGAALGVVAVRRRGWPRRPARLGTLGWPAWVGVLVACVALVPMYRAGTATVTGTGSDAHLAAGTADFLRDHHPGAIAVEEPVDRVPLVWRSKPPIYYPLAAAATLGGVETWEALSPFMAVLLALAALGFFLLATEALGAGLAGAVVAMAAVGLSRVALQTATHPYFNQLWGFLALPFALLLAWWVARSRTRGAGALLVGFLAVGAFAYPLALPIPLLALTVLLWPERRRLRALRRLWQGPRSLLWMVPLAALLALPARGVIEKMGAAVGVVADPTASLRSWGGDLVAFIPEHQFVGLPSTVLLLALGPLFAVAIAWELRRQPRPLALALAGVLVFGALAAAWFRPRDFGWYFHFKVLAFVGPLAVLLAVVAVSRLRRFAWIPLSAIVLFGVQGAKDEMVITFDQTPRWLTEVRAVDERLPPGASVRLDVDPPRQLWTAYFLAGQPLCSQRPLLDTSYPHVPASRKADWILIEREYGVPPDATGGAVWSNERFALYRQRAGIPGPEVCSQRMVQFIERIGITGQASS